MTDFLNAAGNLAIMAAMVGIAHVISEVRDRWPELQMRARVPGMSRQIAEQLTRAKDEEA